MKGYLEYMLSDPECETLGLPGGVLMKSGRSLARLEKLNADIAAIFSGAGYTKVVPPVFEYYETFEQGGGAEIARRSFTFKDREGLLLALRYDMTTPIARMVAMQAVPAGVPQRFSYEGDVFREQPLHKGKIRQIPQAGIELIGLAGIDADAEAVTLMAKALSVLDKDYRLVIGCVGIYRTLLQALNLGVQARQALHSAIDKKDTVSLELVLGNAGVSGSLKETLLELPRLSGRPEALKPRLSKLSAELKSHADEVLALYDRLDAEIRRHIILDFGLIKDFTYYTGLTLEGYLSEGGAAVGSGGRYDGLFRAFGREYPAVGFALDLGYLLEKTDF